MTSEEIVNAFKQLEASHTYAGEQAGAMLYNAAATLIESQASEITTIKSQNERLVKLLDRCVHAVEQEYGIDNWRVEEAKALIAEIKPATVSVEARGANAQPA